MRLALGASTQPDSMLNKITVVGAGNVGASVTKLIGPFCIAVVPAAGFFDGLIPGGWRFVPVVYACKIRLKLS